MASDRAKFRHSAGDVADPMFLGGEWGATNWFVGDRTPTETTSGFAAFAPAFEWRGFRSFGAAGSAVPTSGTVSKISPAGQSVGLNSAPVRNDSLPAFAPASASGTGAAIGPTTGFTVATEGATFGNTVTTTLNGAIRSIDAGGADAAVNTAYTIRIAGAISLTSELLAINLMSGSSLTIEGTNGTGGQKTQTIDGNGNQRGFFVYSGSVTLADLNIVSATAQGGAGGGGGAGLGGGLFIASGASVALDNIGFLGDSAKGGTGGSSAGGGGLGGAGLGGGGGIGGAGGASGRPGSAGIIPGVAGGGAGSGGGAGGLSAGGGGGAYNAGGAAGGGGVGGAAGGNGVGGAGGFGGGGAAGTAVGGAGGFGGGGGAAVGAGAGTGGRGGFGGGGGGASRGVGGAGGFGGGGGVGFGGGGGLGAGGDIFVQQGGVLTIEGGSLGAGTVTAGLAGLGAQAGRAYGGSIFIQGNQTLTLAPPSGQTVTISGTIADETGSHDASGQTGAGSIVVTGGGTVVLATSNTYTGGTTISGGTLSLAAVGAAGSGAITFASGSADTLVISGATMPGNVISGFAPGDAVDLAGVAYSSAATVNLSSGNVLQVSAGGSTDSLRLDPAQNFAGDLFRLENNSGGIAVVVTSGSPPEDFYGSGTSDVLWRNTSSGGTQTWLWDMSGTSEVRGGQGPTAGAGWTIAGTGDFNHDGHADILWQNTTGATTQTSLWEMNGASQIGGGASGNAGAAGWTVAGVGDFYGNGESDILWQNTSGGGTRTWLWEMNGTNQIGGGGPGTAGAGWTIAGIGDFNHDGRSDILWQNATGSATQTWIWEMNGASQIGGGQGPTAGSGWTMAGVGDFYGNGDSDILWRNATGSGTQTWLWEMNGASQIGGGQGPTAGAGWTIAGIGDYNGDGRSDILWQNTSGGSTQTWMWEMSGASQTGGGQGPTGGAGWTIVPPEPNLAHG